MRVPRAVRRRNAPDTVAPDNTDAAGDTSGGGDIPPELAVADNGPELEFDEDCYLRAYPDVAEAVERGELTSGQEHYLQAGRAEQRLRRPEYARQVELGRAAEPVPIPPPPRSELDSFIVSESGAVFLNGWSDDRNDPLAAVSISVSRGVRRTWSKFARLRRTDVGTVLPSAGQYQYGFWVFGGIEDPHRPHGLSTAGECRLELRFASGATMEARRAPVVVRDGELRDHLMSYFAASEYWGNRLVEAFASLDQGGGEQLVEFGRSLSRAVTTKASAEHFGPRRDRYKGSIIVPLLGIADFLFLQACTYALGPGIDDYEFIYVVNSPELIERLGREARIAQTVYGLAQTLVLLPGNAGLGPANNLALEYAQSDRLLFVNPDVFPQDRNWAQLHTDLLGGLPARQTRLFGTTLYYDDGSLMHAGIHFEIDSAVHTDPAGITQRKLIRVEHTGKGAPPGAVRFATPRVVPAVSGAFMSVDRAWFEKLGGFTEDYMFGGYEDMDLCLKSLQAGGPVWVHGIRMWHLEGKGSRRQPQHEGGMLLNRWLFSRKWQSMIIPDLVGRTPRHLLLRDGAGAVPAPIPRPVNLAPAEPPAEPGKRAPSRPARAGAR